ncbi:MAG: RagB/SusD family nutrient uptake outer membrane protein [Bacteroidales bacterium]|nr:RagB/SusD family nutrient uptake outer membrane protein [Bacteroidales bacterium]
MKHHIIVILTIALSAYSCSEFLDSMPPYAVSSGTEMSDSVAVALTNACYKPLQASNLYNMRIWSLDIIAGNSEVGGGGGNDGQETTDCANFRASADNAFALYVWRSPWVGIGQCNLVIDRLNREKTKVSKEIFDRSMGEAHFLRAHYYYILVRLFGGVPIRTVPHQVNDSTDIARRPISECYDLIMADCDSAIIKLPSVNDYTKADRNRVSKEAAMTMLADVLLTWRPEDHYTEVIRLCDEVGQAGYDLEKCRFEDNFGIKAETSKEAIFTVGYSGSTQYGFWSMDNQSSWLSTFMGPRNSKMVAGSYGWNLPTAEFMRQWEEGDLRKDITVLYSGCPKFDGYRYDPGKSTTGYNVRKFLVSKSDSPEYNTNPSDFIVYRYADVLLKKAEALNESGRTSEAAYPLNIVRARAGLKPVSGSISKESMRETIIHERRMELAFEGHRWFDMIRIDDGRYALKFLSSIGKKPTKDRLLFPIPLTEMDSNDLMEQNSGY